MKGHLRQTSDLRPSLGSLRAIALDQKSISAVVGAVTAVCHLYLLKDVCFIVHAQVLFRYESIIATLAFPQFCFLSFCFAFFNPDSFDQIDAYMALFLPFAGSVHFITSSAGAPAIL